MVDEPPFLLGFNVAKSNCRMKTIGNRNLRSSRHSPCQLTTYRTNVRFFPNSEGTPPMDRYMARCSALFSVLYFIYVLAVALPSIGVEIRRLHDTGRSGWWLLLVFIPIVSLVLLVFWIQDSEPGTNQYGPNPKNMPSPKNALQ